MNAGDICYVAYGEPVFHERLLGSVIRGNLWAIITPDRDIYEEEMEASNTDFSFFAYCGPLGSPIPPGVIPGQIYGFGALGALEFQQLLAQARVYAAGVRALLGVPAAGAGPAHPPPHVPPVVNPQDPDVWVSLENHGAYMMGQVVVAVGDALPAGHVTLGASRALIPIDGGEALALKKVKTSELGTFESKDLRILPIKFDPQGSRKRNFADSVSMMTSDDLPGGKLQLEGPSTALQVLRSLSARGQTPVTDHERWVRSSDIAKHDRSLYEMEMLARVLEAMAMTDQLNIPNLKSGELILRRWQLIKEAHRLSPSAPDYSASDYFMGWEVESGANQDLSKYVSERLKDQAAIAKETRKAREEAENKKQGRGNGKGRGGRGSGAPAGET